MQYIESCKQASEAAKTNLTMIKDLLEELEDFDGLVDSPLWGTLQEKLISLREGYQLATELFENTIQEAEEEESTDIDSVLDELTSKLRGELSDILLTTGSRSIWVNVEVSPNTLH